LLYKLASWRNRELRLRVDHPSGAETWSSSKRSDSKKMSRWKASQKLPPRGWFCAAMSEEIHNEI
jgi:hypothetical protein